MVAKGWVKNADRRNYVCPLPFGFVHENNAWKKSHFHDINMSACIMLCKSNDHSRTLCLNLIYKKEKLKNLVKHHFNVL